MAHGIGECIQCLSTNTPTIYFFGTGNTQRCNCSCKKFWRKINVLSNVVYRHVSCFFIVCKIFIFMCIVTLSKVCKPLASTRRCSCFTLPPFSTATLCRNNIFFVFRVCSKTMANIALLNQCLFSSVESVEAEVCWFNDVAVSSTMDPWDSGWSVLVQDVSSLVK